jgi:hypothetical protein
VRTGLLISAVSHVALVALALLGTPKLFQNVPIETIEVDLVRPDEAEPPPKEPEKKPPDESAEWTPLADPAAARAEPAAPETPPSQADPKQPPSTQQARAAPQPSPAQTPAQQQQQQQPWIFDPVNIPALMNLPNAPQPGFDAEASTAANLSVDERTAFKQHLKKCWKLPDGMAATQSTRVTLRVFLKRDGSVAGEPMLIEASASRDGPQLMQAAIRSVKDCQPFAFLPPDRYREWKALDVTFSPKEMSGG